jgi:hypothetical protein
VEEKVVGTFIRGTSASGNVCVCVHVLRVCVRMCGMGYVCFLLMFSVLIFLLGEASASGREGE